MGTINRNPTEADLKKANIIYPAYINKNRTLARGRRIPTKFAIPDPKPNELVDALHTLKGFQVQSEPKIYCRELDKEAAPWRIRYTVTDSTKNNLENKRQILIACAKRIGEVRAKSSQNAGGASTKTKKKNK